MPASDLNWLAPHPGDANSQRDLAGEEAQKMALAACNGDASVGIEQKLGAASSKSPPPPVPPPPSRRFATAGPQGACRQLFSEAGVIVVDCSRPRSCVAKAPSPFCDERSVMAQIILRHATRAETHFKLRTYPAAVDLT